MLGRVAVRDRVGCGLDLGDKAPECRRRHRGMLIYKILETRQRSLFSSFDEFHCSPLELVISKSHYTLMAQVDHGLGVMVPAASSTARLHA